MLKLYLHINVFVVIHYHFKRGSHLRCNNQDAYALVMPGWWDIFFSVAYLHTKYPITQSFASHTLILYERWWKHAHMSSWSYTILVWNIFPKIRHYKKVAGLPPGGSLVKNQPANAGDMGLIPGPGKSHVPWRNSRWATTIEPDL